jgi:membrane protein DedA with SNARE-associated domain
MHLIPYLIHTYGLFVVAGVIGLESMGVPVPGETALIVASAIAGRPHPELNIVEVIITAVAATIVGRIIGYALGARFGYWLLLRYGGYVRITEPRIKLGQYLFLKHGGAIIIVAQFVPVMRTLAGLLAGANRMPWRHFLTASACGAIIWSIIFGFGVYYLGRQFGHLINSWQSWLVFGTVIVAGLIVLGIFVERHEAQLIAKAEQALPGPLQLP